MSSVVALPVEADTNLVVGRTIEAVRILRGMSVPAFIGAMDMPKSTYFRRKRGDGEWTVSEAQKAATVLSVPVATLYEGLGLPSVAGAGFEPATSGSRAQVIDLAARRAARAAA
jgi:hypothetical protein